MSTSQSFGICGADGAEGHRSKLLKFLGSNHVHAITSMHVCPLRSSCFLWRRAHSEGSLGMDATGTGRFECIPIVSAGARNTKTAFHGRVGFKKKNVRLSRYAG